MSAYMILKMLHMLAAYLTITLFVLRLVLDVAGRPGWRTTPLRWVPHAVDTVLLVSAISLLFVVGYISAMPSWIIAKILLLIGYVVAGVFAIKPKFSKPVRIVAAVIALAQVLAIFHLAMAKPVFG